MSTPHEIMLQHWQKDWPTPVEPATSPQKEFRARWIQGYRTGRRLLRADFTSMLTEMLHTVCDCINCKTLADVISYIEPTAELEHREKPKGDQA